MASNVSIIRGTNSKPVASAALVDFFAHQDGLEGQLLLGYPIISSPEGRYAVDAIWVSPQKGVVVFDLIEGHEPGPFDVRQDDIANKLEARLKTYRELTHKRYLRIPVNPVSFAPGVHSVSRYTIEGYNLTNSQNLGEVLDSFNWENADRRVYELALSAIESISTIRANRVKRVVTKDDSRGAKLKRLEDSIATLDAMQGKAVLETVDGVQRIRGLAGSGKTIVLALKAAYLHAQHPEWRIAVTFHTRALKGQFRRLINNFCIEQTGEEPDWDMLRIVHAWGAPGGGEKEGIYHEFCRAHALEYYDFRAARNVFGPGQEFSGACEKALSQVREPKPLYQAILVDEAQDFPPAFLRLCYESLTEPKRLVYAYDELQSLSGASLPPPEEIFGKKADGSPRVRFETDNELGQRQDIILSKCYRNSRPVLVTAHALGFGIYREPPKAGSIGLVQMFDYPQLWEDVGYRRIRGELREGSEVWLRRTEETSPMFLENHSPIDDLVKFIRFESYEEQAEWVARSIKDNLENDELRHDDIVVINPDPLTTRREVGPIRQRLLEMGIQSHTAGIDTTPDVFFNTESDSITFTGIYRAKGNEAGMVYIINAQDCHSSAANLATIRNRLFTAITRSKAWVRVLGVGEGMQKLIDEFERTKQANFELRFTYPTRSQRDQLKIVHRDISAEERKRLETHQRGLVQLLNDIEEGRLHVEDLGDEIREKLEALLRRKG
ncbi:MAG: ATP-binding domain-containing protein [Alicyclobacillus sp.]|nr:ATP-binding domain-containing protein [Alicyclobacillus sp.]